MDSTAASTTPATRPLHPAWTIPTGPCGLANTTGAQSAVRTASAAPAQVVTAASAWVPRRAAGSITTATSRPCTWSSHVQGTGVRDAQGALEGSEKSPARRLKDLTTAPPGRTADQVKAGYPPALLGVLLEERRDVEVVLVPEGKLGGRNFCLCLREP